MRNPGKVNRQPSEQGRKRMLQHRQRRSACPRRHKWRKLCVILRLNTEAQTQKMIVVQRIVVNAHRQTFDVLGSTGNKYTVDIGPTIKCECRDFIYRRTHCKHILMVLTKVFHVNATSAACQSLHLSEPVSDGMLSRSSVTKCASEQVQRQLEHKLYGKPLSQEDDAEGTKRRPLDTSDCPVCFEEFSEAELPVILFCKSCGNNIHKSCFDTWRSQGRSKVTCVYCRAEWVDEASSSKKVNLKHLRNEEGYVNLGELAGLSSKRDTSTYGL
ncbi:hypothetical protein BJV82DRAFT_588249 [Fennellomyces sp. T-0311]|nr:hypothetical protein BJV82DRAFT_588249 [Fennellomyces sp. T-0311]